MKPTALIVYASLTGCTEAMAQLLAKELQSHHIEVDLRHCSQASPQDFMEYDIGIIGTYTYGAHGDLPDEIVDFYFDLEEVNLAGKWYAVFGSGDFIYEFYCKSVDDFDKKLKQAGAKRGAEAVKFELTATDEDQQKIKQMAKKLADRV